MSHAEPTLRLASDRTAAEDPRDLARRSLEIMARGTLEDFRTWVHPDLVNHEAASEPPAARVPGPEGGYATALWLRAAYENLRWDLHEIVVEGDLVVLSCTMRGRHVGPFVVFDEAGEVEQVFPPTGRAFASTQTHWYRVRDGLVIEHWANRDDLGSAKQLGWVPPTPAYLLRMALGRRRARRQDWTSLS